MSFPITCTACHKTFTISDEIFEKKVSGRVVTIKCKSCAQGIRVDGTKGGVGGAAAAAPVVAAGAELAPAAEPLWAVDYPDGQDREFTTAEVIAELQRGAISGVTLVWREGMAEWLELAQVPELAPEWAKAQQAAAAKEAAAKEAAAKEAAAKEAAAKEAAAKKAPAALHQPRAPIPTVTGLAGLPGAVGGGAKPRIQASSSPEIPKPRAQATSSPEIAKPRAQAASSPELLPKPRAQAPSTPEINRPRAPQGSSPALQKTPPAPAANAPPFVPAPMAPPAPAPMAPPAPAPPPNAAPPSPSPLASPAPTLPLPLAANAADVTPPLPESVAKVVSRPPQPQPAFPSAPASAVAFAAAPAIVADHATIEWPEAKKKTPLVIVGIIAAVAVVGGAVALLGSKEEPLPPATPIVGTPAAQPTPAATSTPTRPSVAQSGADTASGSDPVATGPGITPGGGFAEMFAAGARKAESSGKSVAPSARFDPAATKAPLAQAATEAQACKQSGGPTGKVTVVVTFEPNGKASSATITDAPFAGTPTATCISQALKRATIAPFSGLPGTVSKTFSIL